MSTVIVVTGLTAVFLGLSLWSQTCNRLTSAVIEWILIGRYPLRDQELKKEIPTCAYVWPNGQDVGRKFLDGVENNEAWRQQYGSIYRIWAGMKPEIVLTKPDHMKVVFKDSNEHPKAENNDSGYLMSRLLGKCVGLLGGAEWKTLRPISEKAFARNNISNHVPAVYARVKNYLQKLEDKGGRLYSGSFDPVEDFKILPFLVVADIIYGKLSPEMEQQLLDLAPSHEKLFKQVFKGGLSQYHWSKYFPTEVNRTLWDFEARWKAFNRAAYQRALEQSLFDTPVYHLFSALEKGLITSDNVYHTLDEVLYANLDITTSALSWNLVFLAFDQEVQDRARAEIRAQNKETMHSYLQRSTSFLSACINEASRLKPVAPFSVPQHAPGDKVIDGYRIPAGTNYLIDAYALNIKNEFWGSDTHKYRPSRFLEMTSTEYRYNFWRFGFGPRQCMGRFVADVIIRACLAELLDRWELRIPKEMDGEWLRDRNLWVNLPVIQLTCTPN